MSREVDTSSVLDQPLPGWAARVRARVLAVDGEIVALAVVLCAALAIGLATAGDYGLSVDEFNTDDYGPKALAWYTRGFTDRSHFETVCSLCGCTGPGFRCSPPPFRRSISLIRSPPVTPCPSSSASPALLRSPRSHD